MAATHTEIDTEAYRRALAADDRLRSLDRLLRAAASGSDYPGLIDTWLHLIAEPAADHCQHCGGDLGQPRPTIDDREPEFPAGTRAAMLTVRAGAVSPRPFSVGDDAVIL